MRIALVLGCAFMAAVGCSQSGQTLHVLTYNVQNLFDDQDDGPEYSRYRSEAGWDSDRYHRRLVNLSRVLRETVRPSPDVILFQEIEGAKAVRDLLNDYYRRRLTAVVAPERTSPIRVALLSRFPVAGARSHRAEVAAVTPPGQPGSSLRAPHTDWAGRLMLEVDLVARNRSFRAAGGRVIRFIVCHWKSQSGGERETERYRQLESALLATRLTGAHRETARPPTIIAGDLNEDVEEYFQHDGEWQTALMAATPGGDAVQPRPAIRVTSDPGDASVTRDRVVLYSPWLATGPGQSRRGLPWIGSYFHAGRWERLDQFLLAPGNSGPAPAGTISLIRDESLLDGEGRPLRFDSRTGRGHSDHLPVLLELTLP